MYEIIDIIRDYLFVSPVCAMCRRVKHGDWMAENHAEVALCNDWEARRSAIWKLSNEKYWLAMAAATNSLLLSDMDSGHAACMLFAEVCDCMKMEKTVDLMKAEE